MGKKRKTRQEKIIIQLKRELAKKGSVLASSGTDFQPRQEAISPRVKIEPAKPAANKRSGSSIFFYEPLLVKKDLIKTFLLTFFILSLELVLYWKLR